MPNKNIKKFRNMTQDELVSNLRTLELDFFKGKMQLETGQLSNTSSIWSMRKDIARLKTLLTQLTSKSEAKGAKIPLVKAK